MDELYKKIDELESVITIKNEIISKNQHELQEKNKKIIELRKQNMDSQESYEELMNNFNCIKNDYKSIEQKMKFLKNDNENYRCQNENLMKIIDSKDIEIDKYLKYRNDYKELNEKFLLLNKELLNSEKIIENYQEKMNDYTEMISTLEQQIQQMKESYAINLKRNVSFSYSFDASMAMPNDIKIPEQIETIADAKINALENDICKLVDEKHRLEEQLDKFENENNVIKNRETDLIDQIEGYRNEISNLKNENEKLLKNYNQLKRIKSTIMDQINNLKNSFKILKENNTNDLKTFQFNLRNDGDRICRIFNKQIETIQLLSHFKHTYEIHSETVINDNHELRNKLAELELINENLKKNQSQIEDENECLLKRLNELQVKFNNIEQCNCPEMKIELSELKSMNKKMMDKVNYLQNLYKIEKQSFIMERKTKERLLNENLSLEKELRILQKRLDNLTNNNNLRKCGLESNNFDQNCTDNTTKKSLIEKPTKKSEAFIVSLTDNDGHINNRDHDNKKNKPISGIKFEMADEIGEIMDASKPISNSKSQTIEQTPAKTFPNERIKILRERNLALKPHLRTTYPVEFQNLKSFDENIILPETAQLQQTNSNESTMKLRTKKQSSSTMNNDDDDVRIPIKKSKF